MKYINQITDFLKKNCSEYGEVHIQTDSLKLIKKYKNITIPKTVCNLSVYLENNKNKIDYSTYEYNGWFVGSGAIESSNKTVVQLRLKQAGMRWSVDGANYMIALRCMYESNQK